MEPNPTTPAADQSQPTADNSAPTDSTQPSGDAAPATPDNASDPAAKPTTKSKIAELQAQIDSYQAELAATVAEVQGLVTQLSTVTADRDGLTAQVGTLQQAVADAQAGNEAPAEVEDQTAEIKALLVRNGLTKAFVMPDGSISFDEKYARHFVGDATFDTLTVISAE